MFSEKVEKIFWCLIILWFILRTVLLGCQYYGNTDPAFKQEVLKYFSETDITESRNYSLSGFWFKAIYGAVYLIALILLLRFGFFSYLYEKTIKWVGSGFFKNDLLFTLLFYIILYLLSFPSSYYFGYLRENTADFTTINFTGWLIRYFKVISINLLIQTAFVMVVLYIIRNCPQKWPWITPIVTAIVVAGSMLLVPYIITPLFYNEKPLEKGELRDKLFEIAQKADLLFKDYGIWSYIENCYDSLHLEGDENIYQDIINILHSKKVNI